MEALVTTRAMLIVGGAAVVAYLLLRPRAVLVDRASMWAAMRLTDDTPLSALQRRERELWERMMRSVAKGGDPSDYSVANAERAKVIAQIQRATGAMR